MIHHFRLALIVTICTAATPAVAGLRFTPVPGPPDALVISSIAMSSAVNNARYLQPYGLFAVPGRGIFALGSTQYVATPCADGQVVASVGSGSFFSSVAYSAWTNCGLFTVSGAMGVSPAGPGLPAGSLVTSMVNGLVGTSNAGVYSFGSFGSVSPGDALTSSNEGLPSGAAVRSLGFAGGRTYVSLSGGGLYDGTSGAPWTDASTGLPGGATVTATGGTTSAFAAVDAHGIWRRATSGVWRRDSNGANAAVVGAFAGSFAAGGTAGVLRHVDGGWMPETSGLPPGTDARVSVSVELGYFVGGYQRYLFIGTGGQGLFSALASATGWILPAIVDTDSVTGQRFRTELTIGTLGRDDRVVLSFPPSGSAKVVGLGGPELRMPDALSGLHSLGLDPPAGSAATSLSMTNISFTTDPAAAGYMLARVYTTDSSGGTYGVMLDAPSNIDAAEEEASVYGLRSTAGIDRSNLAVVPMPGRSSDPVTLSVQVFSADGTPAPNVLTRTLAPGEFFQWNDVLLLAGLPQGSSGYARISRVAGIGAWTGYGVINDAATSDGSVLPLYRPGGLAAARRLLVPVVLAAFGAAGSHYTTELTLANDSAKPSTALLLYHAAPGYGAPLAAPAVALPVGAGRQVTLPDVVALLREQGVAIPDPLVAGSQAGTLEVVFQGLDGNDAARTVALARTLTPNPNHDTGGRFGVGYSAIAWGGGARSSALVPALMEDASSRSNLAVVNAGGGSEGPITLSVQLQDADTGANTGNPLTVTLIPGEWFQWNRVISLASATTSKAIATVTLVSGDDTFLAYGVLNDAKTSDGSFIRMIPLDGE